MLCDELLCSYKSASEKYLQKVVYVTIDPLIIVINPWIRMKHHWDKTSLLKAVLSMITSVDTILKGINDSLTRNDEISETVNEITDTDFNDMLHNNVEYLRIT